MGKRASMRANRLSLLTIMYVHYGKKVHLDDVADICAKNCPRIELLSVLVY